MSVPKLTLEERREALQKATAARRRRAEIKVALKKKELSLEELFDIANNDDAVAKMRVQTLLESMPRVGTQRAQSIMEEIGIASSRRVRGLGDLQRAALLRYFQ